MVEHDIAVTMRQMYPNGANASSAPAAASTHEKSVKIRYVPA